MESVIIPSEQGRHLMEEKQLIVVDTARWKENLLKLRLTANEFNAVADVLFSSVVCLNSEIQLQCPDTSR